MLRYYSSLPDGFLQAAPAALAGLLGGPSLIELPGARRRPLLIALLLHGNESTGLSAVQQLLARYRDTPLPRRLLLFVGNVAAAAEGDRCRRRP